MIPYRQLALAALIALTVPAEAAITVLTDRAAFLSAVRDHGTDTFDDLAIGRTPGPLARTAGDYSYVASLASPRGFFPVTNGGGDIFLSPALTLDTIIFSDFSVPIAGIGGNFFVTGPDGTPASGVPVTIVATDDDGSLTQLLAQPTATGFIGFLSTRTIRSLRLTADNSNPPPLINVPTVNNLDLGANLAVPEPATWLMLLAGFGMVGIRLRRQVAVGNSRAG